MTIRPHIETDGADALPTPAREPRIATSELCCIAKVSRVTIQRRIKAGRFPAPIDRGKEFIFDRRAVYEALGIPVEAGNHEPTENPWERGAHALAERRSAALRCRQTSH